MHRDVGGSAVDDGFEEVIRYYNLWRRIANFTGTGHMRRPTGKRVVSTFDPTIRKNLKEWPKWSEFGDWAAWIVVPNADGNISVLSSLKHEREAERKERVEVIFSHFSDAGKYVILRIGDSIRSRSDIRLKTLFVNWEARGLDSRIRVKPASREAADFFTAERPTLEKDYAAKHRKEYALEAIPAASDLHSIPNQPRMEVLALSFEELTAALLAGMPESITSQVSHWRQ